MLVCCFVGLQWCCVAVVLVCCRLVVLWCGCGVVRLFVCGCVAACLSSLCVVVGVLLALLRV